MSHEYNVFLTAKYITLLLKETELVIGSMDLVPALII